MWIFYTENKQTGQLIFSFLVTLSKKREKENGMNWTYENFKMEDGAMATNYSTTHG